MYPDPAIIAAVNAAFVPVRLDLRHPKVRELNILWLPTLLILDHRGREHGRQINAAPPEDVLDVLALGEARARLKDARPGSRERAVEVLAGALARREDGPFHPELLYWYGIAGYFQGNEDGAFRDRIWDELRLRYPDSLWARRVPEHLLESLRRSDR